jgi:iron complex outermembrane receptor protein
MGRVAAIGRVDLERRGRQYWTPDNLDVQEPVTLLNLRLTVATNPWSIEVWGKNLTNRRYYVEYGDALWFGIISGNDIGWLGRPLTFGIDFTARFH